MIHSMFIKMGNCVTQEKDIETVKEDIDSDSESFSSLSPISLIKPVHVRKQEQKEQNIREIFTKEYRNQRSPMKKKVSQ
jgi:hypothetical protein